MQSSSILIFCKKNLYSIFCSIFFKVEQHWHPVVSQVNLSNIFGTHRNLHPEETWIHTYTFHINFTEQVFQNNFLHFSCPGLNNLEYSLRQKLMLSLVLFYLTTWYSIFLWIIHHQFTDSLFPKICFQSSTL